MALLRPIAGRVTQPFGGAYAANKPAYGQRDARGWLRAKFTRFTGAAYRADFHMGIDYAAPIGTPVRAVEKGVIVAQGTYPSGEYWVMLRIRRGLRYQVIAFYTHLKAGSFRHRVGATVPKGAIIALSGNTGRSTGPHLHFEIRRGYRWQDPRGSYSTWVRYNPQRLIDGTLSLARIAPLA